VYVVLLVKLLSIAVVKLIRTCFASNLQAKIKNVTGAGKNMLTKKSSTIF
jgi:hypothetical protein